MDLLENGINAKEFAKATGMHFNTVYKMIKKGEIEAIKDGKSYVIPYYEVEKYRKIISNEQIKESKITLDICRNLKEKSKRELDEVKEDIEGIRKELKKMQKTLNEGVLNNCVYEQLRTIKEYTDSMGIKVEKYKSMSAMVKEQEQLYKQTVEINEMIKNDIPITEEYLKELKK